MYSFFIYQSKRIIPNFWQLRFGGLAAALLYMFNPYCMVYLWQEFSLETFLYVSLPILLLLFQRGLAQAQRGDSTWGTIAAIALVTVFASPILGIPAFSIPLAIGFGFFFILNLISIRGIQRRLASARFLITMVAALLLLHMWWIYPTALLYQDQLVRAGGASYGIGGLNDLIFNSAHTSYFNLFRISGIISFYRSVLYPHYDFSWMYEPTFLPLTFLSLSIPITAFVGLASRSRIVSRTSQLFAGMCILAVMPLVAGVQPPFGTIFYLLPYASPAASVLFRDPYQKFGFWLPFGFSFLIGLAFLALVQRDAPSVPPRTRRFSIALPSIRKRVFLLSILLIAMTVGYSWPMFTGAVIPEQSAYVPSARIEIPQYYYQAAAWLRSQEGDFRILSLPKDEILQSSNWTHGYAGGDIMRYLTSDSIISTDPLTPNLGGFQAGLYNYIYNGGDGLAKPLQAMNIRFVMLRLDAGFYPTVTQPANLTRIRNYLDGQQGLSLVREFGSLLFYQLKDPGQLVAASSVVYPPGNITETAWSLANYTGGWVKSSINMTNIGSDLQLSFVSPGAYSYGYATSASLGLSANSYPYLKVGFSSTPNAALLVRVNTDSQRDIWLTAYQSEGATTYGYNQYSSMTPVTITYDLSSIPGTIEGVDLFVTNQPEPTSHSTSEVVIHSMTFETVIVRPNDYVRVIAASKGNPFSSPISDELTSPIGDPNVLPPTIVYAKTSAVEYHVEVTNARQPFVLILGETFDPRWGVSGSTFDTNTARHVRIDGFANGWIIQKTGTFQLEIRFGPGNGFVLGYYVSLVTALFLGSAAILRSGRRYWTKDHT